MYEVHHNYGSTSFENENDAISALWTVGKYHRININLESVKKKLSKYGYCEQHPLSIIKSE